MAVRFNPGTPTIESRPKKTRQGKSVNTILAASSRNKRKKKYRGQGRSARTKLSATSRNHKKKGYRGQGR